MDYLEILKSLLEKNKKLLEDLQQDEEGKKNNKKQIIQVKKEIKSLEGLIKRQEEQKVKELEDKIPNEIKNTMKYRLAIDGYTMQNSVPDKTVVISNDLLTVDDLKKRKEKNI